MYFARGNYATHCTFVDDGDSSVVPIVKDQSGNPLNVLKLHEIGGSTSTTVTSLIGMTGALGVISPNSTIAVSRDTDNGWVTLDVIPAAEGTLTSTDGSLAITGTKPNYNLQTTYNVPRWIPRRGACPWNGSTITFDINYKEEAAQWVFDQLPVTGIVRTFQIQDAFMVAGGDFNGQIPFTAINPSWVVYTGTVNPFDAVLQYNYITSDRSYADQYGLMVRVRNASAAYFYSPCVLRAFFTA